MSSLQPANETGPFIINFQSGSGGGVGKGSPERVNKLAKVTEQKAVTIILELKSFNIQTAMWALKSPSLLSLTVRC